MSENPYAAPAADVTPPEMPPSNAEAIRREHLRHEASIKSVGTVYILGGVLLLLMVAGMATPLLLDRGTPGDLGFGLAMVALFGILAALSFVAGIGLRRLSPRARIPGLVAAALSLINFPIGTLIGAYALWALLSRRGSMILSPGYAEIMARTPNLRFRTPRWNWVVLGIIVVAGLALVIWAVTGS